MARRFGWAPQGERADVQSPLGHWQNKTLIAALRYDRIDAPMMTDGALDGVAFLAYVSNSPGPDALRGRSRCE